MWGTAGSRLMGFLTNFPLANVRAKTGKQVGWMCCVYVLLGCGEGVI